MIRPLPLLAALILLPACATVPPPSHSPLAPVEIRIAGINDFHGNLRPLKTPVEVATVDGGTARVPAGGAAWLAATVAAVRARAPHSLVISAGDMIGASPLESAAFLDEPAIGVMNRIGVDFNALGNHEFDRGWRELKRLHGGGCEKLTGRIPCAVEPDYKGAAFDFLAANVVTEGGGTLFPARGTRSFGEGAGKVTVGVVGLPLKDVPSLVTPGGVAGLTFADEADAANREVAALLAEGADVIVVAIHQGLYTEPGSAVDGCGAVSGDLQPILARLDSRVDLVISGHTHRAYVCDWAQVDPAKSFLVTSAGYGGALVTDIALSVDPVAGRVVAKSARNIVVQSEGKARDGTPLATSAALPSHAPDGAIAAYVARYVAAVAEVSKRPVGKVSGEVVLPDADDVETPLGDMIADSQLAATREAGAQIAFMNNAGVRSGLMPQADGTVTFGDLYAFQPFGNTLVTRTFTGAQLLAMLEQQFANPAKRQILSPSAGFRFAYDRSRPAGQRIVRAALDGQAIEPDRRYRVTMNSFLAGGGDGFTVFTQGTDTIMGGEDIDAMQAWLAAVPVRQLPVADRVTNLTPAR